MRILIVTQYYPPETGGPPNRIHSIAVGLKDAGHAVTVIAPKPNHPEGIIWPEYRDGFLRFADMDGISVIYCSVYTSPKKTFISRIMFYISFVFVSILVLLGKHSRLDVIIGSSPPLFVGIAALVIARLKQSRFLFDVRDLWPDVAVALGALQNKYLVALARRLERFLYQRADGIAAVTDSFCRHIRRLVGDRVPVERVMNGTVSGIFNKDEVREATRASLDFVDKYIVLFAGNLGLAQGLNHVLDAASRLYQTQPSVLVVLLGNGPMKARLMNDVSSRGLENIRFFPRTDLNQAAEYMAAADALLVSLGNHPIYRKFIPSKIFDCMAAGKPVLLSVDGEARTILEKAEAGIYYPAEDANGLVDAVLKLKLDPDAAAEMGRNGRKYAMTYCSRSKQAKIMTRFIEQITSISRERANARA